MKETNLASIKFLKTINDSSILYVVKNNTQLFHRILDYNGYRFIIFKFLNKIYFKILISIMLSLHTIT